MYVYLEKKTAFYVHNRNQLDFLKAKDWTALPSMSSITVT